MRENVVKQKSFDFAVKVVSICQKIIHEQKEFDIGRQFLRSGTAVGALIREAEHAESKRDFIHKLAIAQKECNETIYWIELLIKAENQYSEELKPLNENAVELMKLLTAILVSAKQNQRRSRH